MEQVTLITGASKGIGLACARQLTQRVHAGAGPMSITPAWAFDLGGVACLGSGSTLLTINSPCGPDCCTPCC